MSAGRKAGDAIRQAEFKKVKAMSTSSFTSTGMQKCAQRFVQGLETIQGYRQVLNDRMDDLEKRWGGQQAAPAFMGVYREWCGYHDTILKELGGLAEKLGVGHKHVEEVEQQASAAANAWFSQHGH